MQSTCCTARNMSVAETLHSQSLMPQSFACSCGAQVILTVSYRLGMVWQALRTEIGP